MNKDDVRLNLLFLDYQRQVSRAHTIFSTFFDIALGILFGMFGVVIGLVEIGFIPWNKFYFLLTLFIAFLLIGLIAFFALIKWYSSRIERERIVNKIRIIGGVT